MKVEYKFDKFQAKYKEYRTDNQVKLPLIRYYETDEKFIITFRDKEGVDIYTSILVQTIIDFGMIYNVEVNEAIQDFRINYLTSAERIENDPTYDNVVSHDINKDYIKTFSKSNNNVEESKDYADFISKTIMSWEDKVLHAVDKIDKTYTTKTFGEFLADIMNTINSMPFMGKLRKYIKTSMLEGIETAENETGVQVGFSLKANDKLKALEHQQLNGYTLHDGKQWYGIKGATKEMRFNILKIVENGVKDKKSNKEIKEDIKGVFKTTSNAQADRLARTETTRFINEGKLTAFKESGVDGFKVWRAVNDSKTSDICRALSGTKAELDDPFIDKNGVAHQYPPGHVNCRCVIEWNSKK